MRPLLAIAGLTACSPTPPPTRWKAILVNGGASTEANYQSHRDHLTGVTDVLVQRGVALDDITVLASDGDDPTPDLLTLPPTPDPGDVPPWALGAGPLTDPGGPLAHLWPPMDLVDTAWTRTRVGPATTASLTETLAAQDLVSGDHLLLYTTDHGEPDGSLSLWYEALPPQHLAGLLSTTPEGVRVVVAMSQCHSGAFAEPLLELRDQGVDVCGLFSVPADRQATGCFPDQDGAPIGHGFRIAQAMARSATVDAAHQHLLRFDQGPDVPIRTSDVHLWLALLDEADRRGEDVTATVDRLLAQAPASAHPETRALLAELAGRVGIPVPRGLSEAAALTEQWFAAIDAATLLADDLSLTHQDAVLRLHTVALDAPSDEGADWPARVHHAATDAGFLPLLPTLHAARAEAEAQLWTWTVQEALLARMGWLLVRIAGLELLADDPGLTAVLACEATALPGVPDPSPTPDWSVAGPAPTPPALSRVGVRFQSADDGRPTVLSVHPAGPAAGVLAPGDVITSIDGTPTPWVESVVLHLALAAPGQALAVETDRGAALLTPVAWPGTLAPATIPVEGDRAPEALSWLTPPPIGPHLIVWTAAECPTCGPAVTRSHQWARAMDYSVVVVDDVVPGGLPGALPDLGGWTADAFAVDLLPSIVAVDGTGHIAWRVDGWSPPDGIDLPELSTAVPDAHRFPRAPPQPAHTAHGKPVP